MALEANYCRVRLDVDPGAMLLCTRRSRLAHGGQQVCVGDWVQVDGSMKPRSRFMKALFKRSVIAEYKGPKAAALSG